MFGTFAHDVVCFSHLRWDFVYQRPQHLLRRFAVDSRVFFIEEPCFRQTDEPYYALQQREGRLITVVPILPVECKDTPRDALRLLVEQLFGEFDIARFVAWYYTPMALEFSSQLVPDLTVYDCMDELSLFAAAPRLLKQREAELLERSDLVFTGGESLYQSKRQLHTNVHLFPSAVDVTHFRTARVRLPEPADQVNIPTPRLGFYGVIDERMDLALVGALARERPQWQIVLVGPLAKIDPAALPQRKNIHYLGGKSYDELPAYLAGWDIAIMPFASNDSTRFISPTKTLEYLAGGKPVISTAVHDVVEPYGRLGMVSIADGPSQFISSAEAILAAPGAHCPVTEVLFDSLSWDGTWKRMCDLMLKKLPSPSAVAHAV